MKMRKIIFEELEKRYGRLNFREHLLVGDAITEATKELQIRLNNQSDSIQGLFDNISDLEKQNKELDEALITSTKNNIERQKIIDKMRNCHNCKNWNWKHSRCEKKLKGDCFKASKWELAE